MKQPKGSTSRRFLPPIDLGRRNLVLFTAGIVVLVIGYLLLSAQPWDNPLSRTIAPLVLLSAYLGIFVWAILARSRRKAEEPPQKAS